jgi:hypothetical protein
MIPRVTSSAPGIRVPIKTPLEASLAITPMPPRKDTITPSQ